jgi:hypothetical protein
MHDNETLSEYLSRVAADCPPIPELGGDPTHYKLLDQLEQIMDAMISARERIQAVDYSDAEQSISARNPRFLQEQFDYQYTRRLLADVPRIVERTLRLSGLVAAGRSPSRKMEVYVREATRCYIFGLWAACVALSRAAVEHAIRERVADQLVGSRKKLSEMIEGARRFGVLDRMQAELATRVKLSGDTVLHGGSVTDRDAWDTLVAARTLLEQLHA